MAVDKFITSLVLAADVARREHWRTKSYAQHVALGEFYDGITDLTDKFVETYQGRHGVVNNFGIQDSRSATPIIPMLEGLLGDIEEMRYEAVEKTDTPLQNIIDEIVGQFLHTLYKLKNLK